MKLRDRAGRLLGFLEPFLRTARRCSVGCLYSLFVIWAIVVCAVVGRTIAPLSLTVPPLYNKELQLATEFTQVLRRILKNVAVRDPPIEENCPRWMVGPEWLAGSTGPRPIILLKEFLNNRLFDENLLTIYPA